MTKPKVGILGAGRLGSRLCEELIRTNRFSEISLKSRSVAYLNGITESLKIWLKIENISGEISKFNWDYVNKLDLLVIVIKEKYDPRHINYEDYLEGMPCDLRYAGLKQDLPLILDICSNLIDKQYTGKIIVITNPVDVLTTVIQRILPNITVLGLGNELDSARIYSLLISNFPTVRKIISSYEQLPMIGEHGLKASPLQEAGKWQEIEEHIGSNAIIPIIEQGLKFGYEIVKNIGYTLHDCGSVFREDICWLISPSPNDKGRCISVYHDSGAIGMYTCKDQEARLLHKPIENKSLNEFIIKSRNEISNIADKLMDSRIFKSYYRYLMN